MTMRDFYIVALTLATLLLSAGFVWGYIVPIGTKIVVTWP